MNAVEYSVQKEKENVISKAMKKHHDVGPTVKLCRAPEEGPTFKRSDLKVPRSQGLGQCYFSPNFTPRRDRVSAINDITTNDIFGKLIKLILIKTCYELKTNVLSNKNFFAQKVTLKGSKALMFKTQNRNINIFLRSFMRNLSFCGLFLQSFKVRQTNAIYQRDHRAK